MIEESSRRRKRQFRKRTTSLTATATAAVKKRRNIYGIKTEAGSQLDSIIIANYMIFHSRRYVLPAAR